MRQKIVARSWKCSTHYEIETRVVLAKCNSNKKKAALPNDLPHKTSQCIDTIRFL